MKLQWRCNTHGTEDGHRYKHGAGVFEASFSVGGCLGMDCGAVDKEDALDV